MEETKTRPASTRLDHPQIPTQRQPTTTAESAHLLRRGQRLERAALCANSLEAANGIIAGTIAGSVALTGFGLIGLVEVASSLVVLWHLRTPGSSGRTVLRVIATAFLVIGVSTGFNGIYALLQHQEAEGTLWGTVGLALSVTAMFVLGALKVRTGKRMGSAPLKANGHVNIVDGLAGIGALLGAALTLAFGWWWIDGTCAILIGALAVKVGIDTWKDATGE